MRSSVEHKRATLVCLAVGGIHHPPSWHSRLPSQAVYLQTSFCIVASVMSSQTRHSLPVLCDGMGVLEEHRRDRPIIKAPRLDLDLATMPECDHILLCCRKKGERKYIPQGRRPIGRGWRWQCRRIEQASRLFRDEGCGEGK